MQRFILLFTMMLCVITMASATAVMATAVPLDMSGGCNYDGYISVAEKAHAMLYNPPADWGLGNRMVNTVFGQHSTAPSGRNYAWQFQVSSGTALPADGQVSTSYGLFQLVTTLDSEPLGGFVQTALGVNPNGILPLAGNVVRAWRPHSGSTNWPSAVASVTLPANQQLKYSSINFLVGGSNGKVLIYANYDNGQGGVDSVLIYEAPGVPKTTSETGFPQINSTACSNPDIAEVAAYRMTMNWAQSGDYSDIRTGTACVWTFASPLALDGARILKGFTLAVYNVDTWKARDATIFAASAVPAASTFYVDPINGSPTGSGSANDPWRTLQEVFSLNRIESRSADGGAIKNSGAPVKAGDTIVLRSGYHGDISVSNYYNDDLITVIAQQGHNPQLRRLNITGFKNWRFSGLEISTQLSPTFAKLGLVTVGGTSSYVTVDDCLVYCVSDITGYTAQNWIDNTANGITVGVDCRHVQILNNVVRNTAHAINLSGMNLLASGNQIINYRGDGIRALNNDQTVEYNLIKNCYQVDANHDDGIQVFKHNVSQGLIVNMIIRGNYILDHEDFSQPLASSPQGIGIFEGPHENFRIENNLVITNHWHGITLYWARNSTIINNTVVNPKYIAGTSSMNTWIAIEKAKDAYGGEFSQDCRIANNLAHSFRTGGNTNLVFQNNLSVTRTNYDTIFANFSLGNYTLKAGGPAIDAGSAVDAPMLDILLNPRPNGQTWDIGCYEYYQ